MSRYTTTLHVPVAFELPAGTTATDYARFLADEAALDLEKMGYTDGEITVGEVRIDPVAAACQSPADPAPAATSNADAAGWDDPLPGEPKFFCAHHGHCSDDRSCPDCAQATGLSVVEPGASFEVDDRVRIEPDPAMPYAIARRLHGATGTLVTKVATLRPSRRVWRVLLDGDLIEVVQVREDALRHLSAGSAD